MLKLGPLGPLGPLSSLGPADALFLQKLQLAVDAVRHLLPGVPLLDLEDTATHLRSNSGSCVRSSA
jgi:hypothetical protein